MQIKPGCHCPLLNKDCITLQCAWFTQVRGTNPNTGEPVDEWGCAVAWAPMLLIENAQQSRQTGAAVESFRNEMVTNNEANRSMLIASAQFLQRTLPPEAAAG